MSDYTPPAGHETLGDNPLIWHVARCIELLKGSQPIAPAQEPSYLAKRQAAALVVQYIDNQLRLPNVRRRELIWLAKIAFEAPVKPNVKARLAEDFPEVKPASPSARETEIVAQRYRECTRALDSHANFQAFVRS